MVPRGYDIEIVELMHRTHMGVDQEYHNIIKQCTRTALSDGWGGSMISTDLQDILFGMPGAGGRRDQPGGPEGRPRQHHHPRP